MGIDLHPVTACPDPGLDRFERQPTDSQDSSSRFRLLCFTLGTGLGPGRFHSFAIGLGCHNEFPPVFVVVRAGEVVDRFASSLYLVTMRIGHLAETAAAQCFPRLFSLFAPPQRIDRGGPLDGPRPPKIARSPLARGASHIL